MNYYDNGYYYDENECYYDENERYYDKHYNGNCYRNKNYIDQNEQPKCNINQYMGAFHYQKRNIENIPNEKLYDSYQNQSYNNQPMNNQINSCDVQHSNIENSEPRLFSGNNRTNL